MGLSYNPKDATQCWPENEYQATLTEVKESTSKVKPDGTGGNPMEVWTFTVYSPGGKEKTIKDYVTVPACTFKIRALADALNKREEFDAGQFQAENYIGKNVMLELKVEQQVGFDDQNRIGKIKPMPKQNGSMQRPAGAPGGPKRPAVTNPVSDESTVPLDDCPF